MARHVRRRAIAPASRPAILRRRVRLAHDFIASSQVGISGHAQIGARRFDE
jgi:hypothetical protein